MRLRDFVFAYAKSLFSHDAPHIVETQNKHYPSMLMHFAETLKGKKMFSEEILIEVILASSYSMFQRRKKNKKNAQMHAL